MALLSAALILPALAQDKPRSLYDGASVLFEQAQLIKPRENTNLGLAFTLAPLVVQEVRDTNERPSPGLKATLSPSDGERAGVRGRTEFARTRVFFQPGAVRLNGREYVQMTYWWSYDSTSATPAFGLRGQAQRDPAFKGGSARLMKAPSPLRSAGAVEDSFELITVQGVRVTLSAHGSPVIFEVLSQRGSITQIYVAQSVEAAAQSEFGAALPGRRHSVECSLDEAPDVVVPRVIDDPPAVMGPILYLRSGTREVATLICRCMDSQAKTLVGQSFYELVPANSSRNTSDATRLEAAIPRGLPKDFLNQTNRLSRSLRLPEGF